ncbi:MAG: response regulator transcription factor [Acidimicrobiales bacterium]|jgi:OmpR family response regulator RpaB|nr:response regulator transcription factor [Actinomycetales bacterium]MDP7090556.1 response regulator transcription factor [Dehalococcoidia bacterium]MEE1522926.1 response regulator transcription factor [Acidimicrobiales bacterium]HJL66720.1 response regulator transcription factor [Arenicellales bacterium]|tara:strand:- start:846 stop:1511 length:666 start_codon:yes stop_codon:yes gene_type:complete
MHRILLIDDDEQLVPRLVTYFRRFDLDLVGRTRPSEGLLRLQDGDIAMVILDIMLPEMDGFEVCRRIRKQSGIPILMLTARGEVTDRVVGLELGADDYLAKPFEPRELVARVQSILRRTQPDAHLSDRFDFGDLVVDRKKRQVSVLGTDVSLTAREYELLDLLASHPGQRLHRDEILSAIRGIESDIYSRSVDVAISRLRQKLKPTQHIRTIWGFGYEFVE